MPRPGSLLQREVPHPASFKEHIPPIWVFSTFLFTFVATEDSEKQPRTQGKARCTVTHDNAVTAVLSTST